LPIGRIDSLEPRAALGLYVIGPEDGDHGFVGAPDLDQSARKEGQALIHAIIDRAVVVGKFLVAMGNAQSG